MFVCCRCSHLRLHSLAIFYFSDPVGGCSAIPFGCGGMPWHSLFSELSLAPCLACRLSRFPTRHWRNSAQPVRRHGHLVESSRSAKGGTRRVWRRVAGL